MATALIGQALTDLPRVKRHLGINDNSKDSELVDIINEVSAFMANQCHRNFRDATYSHTGDSSTYPRLQPQTPTLLALRHPPVTQVTSLTDYSGGTTFTQSDDGGVTGDFVLMKSEGLVQLVNGNRFTYWDRPSVECIYSGGFLDSGAALHTRIWGWDEAAKDVQLAATRYAAWQFRQKDKNIEAVLSLSSGGTTVTYKDDDDLKYVWKVINARRWALPR